MTDERYIELAEARVTAETELAVRGIVGKLAEPGATICETCGDPIEADRREALPSARTCIDCARQSERVRRHG